MNPVAHMTEIADRLYSLRDTLGASKAEVFRYVRTWPGEVGAGVPVNTETKIEPSPRIVSLEHRRRTGKHGQTREGDLFLKGFLKKDWSSASELDNTAGAGEEKFWKINGALYTVVRVEERQVT